MLNEMDGIQALHGVIVVPATNRLDVIVSISPWATYKLPLMSLPGLGFDATRMTGLDSLCWTPGRWSERGSCEFEREMWWNLI
jgi:hypothetical protein